MMFEGVWLVAPLRLVLVTQRFWPLMGGPQKIMADQAVELTARGHDVTILTARWRPQWPGQIRFHDVPVVRLAPPPEGNWKTMRYVRSLRRWLAENVDRYDMVYVSGLKHDACAAMQSVGRRVPVVLRAESAGRFGDCLWQIDAAGGRRIKQRCMEATALVGPGAVIERELQAAGYPRSRIHRLPNGVPIPPAQTPKIKHEARSMLADANKDLRIPDWVRLAIYVGRFDAHRGLDHLLTAWKSVNGRCPNVRLWLAGDGPDRPALERRIETLQLSGRVVPAGVFGDAEPLLAAADLFILPSAEGGTSLALIEAMAAGLPIVAGDTAGNRAVITDRSEGLFVPPGDPDALAAAITRLLDGPEPAAALGAAARNRAVEEFSLAKMVDRHATLFERLVQ